MKKILTFVILLFILNACQKKEDPFVAYRQDVTTNMIIDETFVIGGKLTINSNNSKIVRVITLPSKTKYWAFWYGVGQEAKAKYLENSNNIINAAKAITNDPIIAWGLDIIKTLNIMANSGSDNIDVFFASNQQSANNFLNGNQWYYLSFFNGEQSVNNRVLLQMVDTPQDGNRRLYMTFQNYKDFRDLDVHLKVYAFVEK